MIWRTSPNVRFAPQSRRRGFAGCPLRAPETDVRRSIVMELSPTTSRTAETRNPGSGISGARFTTARSFLGRTARSFLGRTRTKNLDKMVTELRQRKQSVSDSRLQAKATKILHRNNAQEILQALATLVLFGVGSGARSASKSDPSPRIATHCIDELIVCPTRVTVGSRLGVQSQADSHPM
jgi:hypothetical protein